LLATSSLIGLPSLGSAVQLNIPEALVPDNTP
jgi:hypothetical protein